MSLAALFPAARAAAPSVQRAPGDRAPPLSRRERPKQFLDLLGTGRSLIQWTYQRFKHICPQENIFFIIKIFNINLKYRMEKSI